MAAQPKLCGAWAHWVGRLLALLLLAVTAAPSPAAAAPTGRFASAADVAGIAAQALALPEGGSLTIRGVALEGRPQPASLELEEVPVWAPGARVVLQRRGALPRERAPPPTRFFNGGIAGNGASSTLLSVHANGTVDGIVQLGRRAWSLRGQPARRPGVAAGAAAAGAGQPPAVPLAASAMPSNASAPAPPFRCGTEPGNAGNASANHGFEAWLAAGGASKGGGSKRGRQLLQGLPRVPDTWLTLTLVRGCVERGAARRACNGLPLHLPSLLPPPPQTNRRSRPMRSSSATGGATWIERSTTLRG